MRHLALTSIVILALVIGLVAGPMLAPASHADDKAPVVETDPALVAVGGLTVSDLWTTFVVIGAVGDHFSKQGYTVEQLQSVINTRIRFCTNAQKNLKGIYDDPKVTKGDKEFVKKSAAAYAKLIDYANALITFAKNRTPENGKDFVAKQGAAKTAVFAIIK